MLLKKSKVRLMFKKYSDKEKAKYFENKAIEVDNKYKNYKEVLNDKTKCMTYGNIVITNSNKALKKVHEMISDKEYQKDMYKILYYTARASGDDHSKACLFAKENIKEDFCIDTVLHIEDIKNSLRGK